MRSIRLLLLIIPVASTLACAGGAVDLTISTGVLPGTLGPDYGIYLAGRLVRRQVVFHGHGTVPIVTKELRAQKKQIVVRVGRLLTDDDLRGAEQGVSRDTHFMLKRGLWITPENRYQTTDRLGPVGPTSWRVYNREQAAVAKAEDLQANDGDRATHDTDLSGNIFTNDYLVYWILEVFTRRSYSCHEARSRGADE